MSTFISRGPGCLSRFSDSLRARRFGDRIPVGKIYRRRLDWPCEPPSFLYNGYRLYAGVLWRGRGVDHPPPSSIEWEGMSDRFSKSCIAIRAQHFLFICDTHAEFPPLQVCHRKIKRNYPGNECFKQGDNLVTRKIFGASGYISDSNRNAEGLLTTADNGEYIENSITFSQADSHIKMWRFTVVSGTDCFPIFRVLLVVWLYQPISKCARTNWWRFLPYQYLTITTPCVTVHYSRESYKIGLFWSHVSMCQ